LGESTRKGRAAWGSAFAVFEGPSLRCATATDEEVRDKGDDREDQKQVNEEAADMQEKEPTYPGENEDERQKKKHGPPPYAIEMSAGALVTRYESDTDRKALYVVENSSWVGVG
jgi:hypothetical protein